MITAAPHIAGMAPYALAPITDAPGTGQVSLSQNESLRPPSPKAIEAAARAAQQGELYPDANWRRLAEALADLHRLNPAQILCGSGSLDLIGCIARVFSGPDRSVLAPAHAYPFFRMSAQMANARFDVAPEPGLTVSVDALLDAVRPDTALVFVANPGNPTGTRIPGSELRRLRQNLADHILLVIDEAYGEFTDHLHDPLFDLIESECAIILRTLSKAYGLAGFRIGWGVFPDTVSHELRKVLNPNSVSSPAQAAATAAVRDHSYMRETCDLTIQLRDEAIARSRQLGLDPLESQTNFILYRMANEIGATNADACLRAKGLLLRGQAGAGLPHCLRMTVASQSSMNAAVDVLSHWTSGERT